MNTTPACTDNLEISKGGKEKILVITNHAQARPTRNHSGFATEKLLEYLRFHIIKYSDTEDNFEPPHQQTATMPE